MWLSPQALMSPCEVNGGGGGVRSIIRISCLLVCQAVLAQGPVGR